MSNNAFLLGLTRTLAAERSVNCPRLVCSNQYRYSSLCASDMVRITHEHFRPTDDVSPPVNISLRYAFSAEIF